MKIKYYQNLGKNLDEKTRKKLIRGLRRVGERCFSELPEYQCLSLDCNFKRHVITVAYDGRRIVGFSSALRLIDEWGEPFLHLGLTCVHPDYRGKGLTHKMAGRLMLEYVIRNRLFGRVWFSNIAGVVSSLANVGKNLDEVFPSPGYLWPSKRHDAIANTISKRYRDLVHIGEECEFDKNNYVFRQSAKGNMWEKASNDARYHHRDEGLNTFYLGWMDLDDGDEMIQVGSYSIFTFLRYLVG